MGLTSVRIAVVFGMAVFQGPARPRRMREGRSAALAAFTACATLAAALPGAAAAAEPSAFPAIPEPGPRGARPSATLPVPPRRLPEAFSLHLPTLSRPDATRPAFKASDFRLSSAVGSRAATGFDAPGFSGRLMSRMRHEALRYRRQSISDLAASLPDRLFEDLDSVALERRSEEASRIVTRSVRRALDLEIERLARTSLGLGPTIDLLGHLSSRGVRPHPPAGDSSRPGHVPSPPSGAGADRRRGSIGMRLDAHPALVMRSDFLRFAGRIEVPVRNEPVRLSLECPVGPKGRAVLSSGMPRDGQGWATLTFNFSF